MSGAPYFSLITPMYDRSSTIVRAVESCLGQTDPDFELLVVDDGSNDDSAAVVASFEDERVRLLRHAVNRGPCPARNTAIAHARGAWFIMLDSDFSLLPHALERLRERTRATAPDVGNVASSCEWDDGRVTPSPGVPDGPVDFTGYVRWIAATEISEKLECVRREVFDDLGYPDSRAWEFEFHLDLAMRWKVTISREVLVRVHSDAPNRLTTSNDPRAVARVIRDAPDKLESFERVLRRHGAHLRRSTPMLYDYVSILAATQAACTGERRRALRHLGSVLGRHPLSPVAWAVGVLVLLGPRAAAWSTVQRRRWRA